MLRKVKKVCSALTTLCVILVVIGAILLVGVRVVGLEPYVVLSGSMEPAYHVGSLIYVRKVDPAQMQANDPVTYQMEDGTVVTHRIVQRVEDPNRPGRFLFRTKGDANNMEDGPLLAPEYIIGKPVFSIPYMGYVSYFVQKPPGTYVVISACLFLLVLPAFVDSLIAIREKKDEAPQEPEN